MQSKIIKQTQSDYVPTPRIDNFQLVVPELLPYL